MITRNVRGKVHSQYTIKKGDTMKDSSVAVKNGGIPNIVATAVAGKKIMDSKDMLFITELSCRADKEIAWLFLTSCC